MNDYGNGYGSYVLTQGYIWGVSKCVYGLTQTTGVSCDEAFETLDVEVDIRESVKENIEKIVEGRRRERIKNMRAVMQSLSLPYDEAADIIKLSDTDREEIRDDVMESGL